MNKRLLYMTRSAMLGLTALLLGTFLLTGCGGDDDPVEPPKDYGFSKVTFLHANPGRTNEVAFFRNDSTTISVPSKPRLAYDEMFVSTVPNGENLSYSVKAIDGTELANTTGSHDSSQIATLIFSGNATTSDLFLATTNSIATPGSGNVAIRFVHAAMNEGPRSLKLGSSSGATVVSDIAYKGASSAYVSIGSDTKILSIVDESTTPPTSIDLSVDLSVAKVWTVVLMGSKAALSDELKLKGKLIADQ